jgi:hypothetical protein
MSDAAPKLTREVVHPTIYNRKMISDERKQQLRVIKKAKKALTRLREYLNEGTVEGRRYNDADCLVPDAIDALHALLKEIE